MRFVDFKNIGAVVDTVNTDILNEVKLEVREIESNFAKGKPHNQNLAGNILHEYVLTNCRDSIEKLAISLAQHHEEKYQCFDMLGGKSVTGSHSTQHQGLKLAMSTLWVNFQKKHEFNPIHTHNGVYSFVLWLEVPYFMEFEKAASPGRRSPMNKAGAFEFIYTNILGDVVGEVIEVDNNLEGTICLFPARLPHLVYPFFSTDKTRISISGNLYIV